VCEVSAVAILLLFNIFILTIIISFSLRGYIILREKNIGLISLAFIFFLFGDIIHAVSWFFPFSTGWNIETIFTFWILIDLIEFSAITVLIYAFIQNGTFNQIKITKWQLVIICLSALIAILIMIINPIELVDLLFGAAYESLSNYVLAEQFGHLVISVPLVILLYNLIKYYRKSKNAKALWTITGFSCMLFLYASPGMILVSWVANALCLNSSLNFEDYNNVYIILNSSITLIAYLSFLMVLIRTRVSK
jgi:hypothetical protein